MAFSKSTQRFLEKVRGNRTLPALNPPIQHFDNLTIRQRLQQPVPQTPLHDVMDILVGGEGEELMLHSWNNSIAPSLDTPDVGNIIGSVMSEMPEFNPQPMRMRRGRR